ncbi:Ribonuclease H-like superfamily [Sesbania bispinosa]|nr:Ribonuclease H-like superfamily [Sesbania bispinosa]
MEQTRSDPVIPPQPRMGNESTEPISEAKQMDNHTSLSLSGGSNQEDHFGPWMIVKKQQRRRQNLVVDEGGQSQQAKVGKGSRFDILNEEAQNVSNAPVNEPKDVAVLGSTPGPKDDSFLSKPIVQRVRNSTGGKIPSPVMESTEPQDNKAEEREIFALMKQYQKEIKEYFLSSKAIFQNSAVPPDCDTLRFLENQHSDMGLHPKPLKPPDQSPDEPCIQIGVPIGSEGQDSEIMQVDDPNACNPAQLVWTKVLHNISWRVNSGRETSLWSDSWVPNIGPLQLMVNDDLIDNLTAKVSDYLDDNGDWDILRLHGVLPPSILVKVQAMIPPSIENGTDVIAWGKKADGSFTVAAAYSKLVGFDNLSPSRKFKQIWSWNGPQRIKTLLWKISNNALLTNVERFNSANSVESVWHRTIHIIEDIRVAYGINKSPRLNKSMDRDLYIRWIPPSSDWLKLNTDGAMVHSDNSAGCGGVLRDHCGRFIGAFSSFLGDCSILTAELRALWLGIKWIIKKNISKLGCHYAHISHSLVEDIRKLSTHIPDLIWNHTKREGNFLADAFASYAIKCKDPWIEFSSVPIFASPSFIADVTGTAFRRGFYNSL